MDYVDASLMDVTKYMAEITCRNFILSDDLKGQITIISHQQVQVAEAYEAYLSALEVAGYTTVTVGKNTKVVWDVLQSTDGKNYRVRDVGISLGGAVLWLASDQQAQFESFLDRNNGKIDALIGRINEMIAEMDARKKAGTGSTMAKKAN
jgi:type II secretory pathway component GspD/PulD (secretin)